MLGSQKPRVMNARMKAEEYSKRQQNPKHPDKWMYQERVLGLTYSSCDSEERLQDELQKYQRLSQMSKDSNTKLAGDQVCYEGADSGATDGMEDRSRLTPEQAKIQKKLISMKRSMMLQQSRSELIFEKIKKHTELEESRQQLKDAPFVNLRKQFEHLRNANGLNKNIGGVFVEDNQAKISQMRNFFNHEEQKKNSVIEAIQQDSKVCHKVFKSIEQATNLLVDELGRFVPTDDICKMCRQPFTIDQKMALLSAAMEKQKELQITSGAFNAKKQNLYVNNTSQGKAMNQWAQNGEIPIDASLIKVRGVQEEKPTNYLKEVSDSAANRFMKKLIVEENMHLVKMSSKSGNGHVVTSGMTIERYQNRIHSSMVAKGVPVHHNIDILALKRANRPKEDLARSTSPHRNYRGSAVMSGSPNSYKDRYSAASPTSAIKNFSVASKHFKGSSNRWREFENRTDSMKHLSPDKVHTKGSLKKNSLVSLEAATAQKDRSLNKLGQQTADFGRVGDNDLTEIIDDSSYLLQQTATGATSLKKSKSSTTMAKSNKPALPNTQSTSVKHLIRRRRQNLQTETSQFNGQKDYKMISIKSLQAAADNSISMLDSSEKKKHQQNRQLRNRQKKTTLLVGRHPATTDQTTMTNEASTMINHDVNVDLMKVNSNQSHVVNESQTSYQAMVASRSTSNMIQVRSRNSFMPKTRKNIASKTGRESDNKTNAFGSQQIFHQQNHSNAQLLQLPQPGAKMNKSVTSIASACDWTSRSHLNMATDNNAPPASEKNMHAVNDRNLRRSVSKLKIKLQTKMNNHKVIMDAKAHKQQKLQKQQEQQLQQQMLQNQQNENDVSGSQMLNDGITDVDKSYRLSSVNGQFAHVQAPPTETTPPNSGRQQRLNKANTSDNNQQLMLHSQHNFKRKRSSQSPNVSNLNLKSRRSSGIGGPQENHSNSQFINSHRQQMMPRITGRVGKRRKSAGRHHALKVKQIGSSQQQPDDQFNFDDSQTSRTIQLLEFEQQLNNNQVVPGAQQAPQPGENGDEWLQIRQGKISILADQQQPPQDGNALQKQVVQSARLQTMITQHSGGAPGTVINDDSNKAIMAQQPVLQRDFSLPQIARRRSSKLKAGKARFDSMGNVMATVASGRKQNNHKKLKAAQAHRNSGGGQILFGKVPTVPSISLTQESPDKSIKVPSNDQNQNNNRETTGTIYSVDLQTVNNYTPMGLESPISPGKNKKRQLDPQMVSASSPSRFNQQNSTKSVASKVPYTARLQQAESQRGASEKLASFEVTGVTIQGASKISPTHAPRGARPLNQQPKLATSRPAGVSTAATANANRKQQYKSSQDLAEIFRDNYINGGQSASSGNCVAGDGRSMLTGLKESINVVGSNGGETESVEVPAGLDEAAKFRMVQSIMEQKKSQSNSTPGGAVSKSETEKNIPETVRNLGTAQQSTSAVAEEGGHAHFNENGYGAADFGQDIQLQVTSVAAKQIQTPFFSEGQRQKLASGGGTEVEKTAAAIQATINHRHQQNLKAMPSSGEVSIRLSKQLTPKLQFLKREVASGGNVMNTIAGKIADNASDEAVRSAGNCTTTNIVVSRLNGSQQQQEGVVGSRGFEMSNASPSSCGQSEVERHDRLKSPNEHSQTEAAMQAGGRQQALANVKLHRNTNGPQQVKGQQQQRLSVAVLAQAHSKNGRLPQRNVVMNSQRQTQKMMTSEHQGSNKHPLSQSKSQMILRPISPGVTSMQPYGSGEDGAAAVNSSFGRRHKNSSSHSSKKKKRKSSKQASASYQEDV